MYRVLKTLLASAALTSATLAQAVTIGQPAPAFEVKDASGKLVKLACAAPRI
jgi:hypothetical protein